MWPTGGVAADIVAEHILPPATICVDVHGTYCRRLAHIFAEKYRRWRQYLPTFTAQVVGSRQSQKNKLRDDGDDGDYIIMIIIFSHTKNPLLDLVLVKVESSSYIIYLHLSCAHQRPEHTHHTY